MTTDRRDVSSEARAAAPEGPGLAWPHADGLHLVLSSLGTVLVDQSGVRSMRAEDASGGFGLWPGHADFLTVLSVGVLSWRDREGAWHHAALRGGVLSLRRGAELAIATREAMASDDLVQLEHQVLAQLRQREGVEAAQRRQSRQLEVSALRELVRPLKPRGLPTGDWP
jgi:F-type H+-transporting ATPase subunit epsilon